jgi:hypothetical protein
MPAAESTRHAPARRPSRPSSPRGLVGPGRVQARLPSSTPRYIVTRAGIPSHPRAPSPSSPRRASAPHRATRPGKLTHRGMDQRFHEAYLNQPAHGREAARPGRALPGGARLISRGGAAPTHESRRRDRVVGTVGERTGRPTGGPRPLVPSGGPGCAASSPGPWSPSGLGSTGSQSGSSGAAPALVANYDLEATPQRFAPCGSRSDRGSLAV